MLIAALGVTTYLILPARRNMVWVGSTVLRITFRVSDDADGTPVPGAQIWVRTDIGSLCGEEKEKEFVLVTDANGAVSVSRECMCFGTSGPGINTFHSHLPSWWITVAPAGYQGMNRWLDQPEDCRRVNREKEGASLEVPIRLKKLR